MSKKGNVVYLSGPITGAPNYKEKFLAAEQRLQARGYVVLNPARLPEGLDYEEYMALAFAMLDVSDVLLAMVDWESSKGAIREQHYADAKQKDIMLEGAHTWSV